MRDDLLKNIDPADYKHDFSKLGTSAVEPF